MSHVTSTATDLRDQVRLSAALALTICIGVVGANAATASFTDVPGENQHAESLSRVQEAGIATGFSDGTFRPTRPLSRQQGAVWIDRSSTRVALDVNVDGSTTLNAANPTAEVARIEMTSPAAQGGRGWVTIQGGIGGISRNPGSTCPCPVDAVVLDQDDNIVGRSSVSLAYDPTGHELTISPILAVVPIDGGDTHTYRVVLTLVDPSDEVRVGGAVYASYAPMIDGEPGTYTESSNVGPDPVESMVP